MASAVVGADLEDGVAGEVHVVVGVRVRALVGLDPGDRRVDLDRVDALGGVQPGPVQRDLEGLAAGRQLDERVGDAAGDRAFLGVGREGGVLHPAGGHAPAQGAGGVGEVDGAVGVQGGGDALQAQREDPLGGRGGVLEDQGLLEGGASGEDGQVGLGAGLGVGDEAAVGGALDGGGVLEAVADRDAVGDLELDQRVGVGGEAELELLLGGGGGPGVLDGGGAAGGGGAGGYQGGVDGRPGAFGAAEVDRLGVAAGGEGPVGVAEGALLRGALLGEFLAGGGIEALGRVDLAGGQRSGLVGGLGFGGGQRRRLLRGHVLGGRGGLVLGQFARGGGRGGVPGAVLRTGGSGGGGMAVALGAALRLLGARAGVGGCGGRGAAQQGLGGGRPLRCSEDDHGHGQQDCQGTAQHSGTHQTVIGRQMKRQ